MVAIAEIHGKSPYTNSEDFLTADVFGAFRYLPAEIGILGFLRSIVEIGEVLSAPNVVNTEVESSAAFFFWPLGEAREPDVLVELNVNGALYHVVVEAKYLSGPSDLELQEIEHQEDIILIGNQLADQLRELAAGEYTVWQDGTRGQIKRLTSHCEHRFLLYLTAHPTRPDRELAQSAALVPDHAHRLCWASWYHVYDYLQTNRAALATFPYNRIVQDALALLARKQFGGFDGVRPPPLIDLREATGSFWTGRRNPLPPFHGIARPPHFTLVLDGGRFWHNRSARQGET